MRTEKLQREYNVKLQWIAFPLHPGTPEEGQTLEQLFAGVDIDIPRALSQLTKVAGELNLPWSEHTMTYNSRKATELGKWAEDSGKARMYHDSVFRAYFVDGLNIADSAILKALCRNLGMDPDEAERVLAEQVYKKAVDDDWRYAKSLGITVVPTFRAADMTVVGAQPYEILEELIRSAIYSS